jgi:MFS family permease
MVESLLVGGVGIYAFYALQPYLLELWGDPEAYQIAGLVAAIAAGAQILGGVVAPRIRALFHRRTSGLIVLAVLNVVTLGLIGTVDSFWAVLGMIVAWGLLFAAATPIRQAYMNGMIPSRQRATILSFDSLMSSTGGVWAQPVLGRAADMWGYASSYLVGAGISALAVPALVLSRRQNNPADTSPTRARALSRRPSPSSRKAGRARLPARRARFRAAWRAPTRPARARTRSPCPP